MPIYITIIAFSLLLRLFYIGSINLLAEEAYYWNYAQHLDFSYLDHPPMVAYLIKLFTILLGLNEFGVRAAALLCWTITALFSFKLTEEIKAGSGKFSVLVLSILPFFFVHSLIITPDLPLLVCWSASLYYLFLALEKDHNHAWYWLGLWLGLGLDSKYTIVLLGLGTFMYMIYVPKARKWFFRFEPYLALVIALLIFSPVIYWNAKHNWASFIFQSTRRLSSISKSSLHELLGLFLVFLTPVGCYSFWKFIKVKNYPIISKNSRYFICIFTFAPLIFFSIFSLCHEIKFNWIGPAFLSIIPCLSIDLATAKISWREPWIYFSFLLLSCYFVIIFCLWSGKPQSIQRLVLNKYIAWDELTLDFYKLAKKIEEQRSAAPILVPLDRYNIASELSFYQAKLAASREIRKIYPIVGSQIFDGESLMYSYWDKNKNHKGSLAILISTYAERFYYPAIQAKTIVLSPINEFWAFGQGKSAVQIRKYYYQLRQIK